MSAEPKQTDQATPRAPPSEPEPLADAHDAGAPSAPRVLASPISHPGSAPVSSRRRPLQLPIASKRGLPDLPLVNPANYAVDTEISRGGLARILRAMDLRLGRPIALKILRDPSRQFARRFVREIAVAARLQHPCILPIYEAGRFPDGSLFYTMRLVSGAPFGAVLRRAKSLDARLALLPHLLRVTEAIAYAHDRRIIHRDLKPENILVGDHGETVVIDWGFAKNLADKDEPASLPESAGNEALTRKGMIIGTPVYMAPEQSRGEVVDERVDVYALGAILYHLLAGRLPYEEQHPVKALKLVSEGPPPPLSQRARGAPRELVAIAARAMARTPEERYPSARELADDLRRWKDGQPVAAHRYTRMDHVNRWFTQNATVSSACVSALIVMVIVGSIGIRSVLAERDRAERKRVEARAALLEALAAQDEATARADDLTLLHAKAALERDPTLALAWLKRLSPSFQHWDAARPVVAEARRRGAAQHVPPPPEGGLREWLDKATDAVVDPGGKLVILPR